MTATQRCPGCGYTIEDVRQYMDHKLCSNYGFFPGEECDHEYEVIDESFDHEYGTEQIVFERCKLCDAERQYEPPHCDDDVI